MKLIQIYKKLLKEYGNQNWWPVKNKFKPREWEVVVGAILTQNTNWGNVEKALQEMKNAGCISVKDILATDTKELQKLIRSSGFFNQKAERLKTFAEFVSRFPSFKEFQKTISREDLLKVKGIGPETADSILLYACNRPYFVIDAYTRRLCHLLWPDKGFLKKDYEDVRKYFEDSLPKSASLYNEFHALIVRAGKDGFDSVKV